MQRKWESVLTMVSSHGNLVDIGVTMFFVGDAAGRIAGNATSRTADHGDSDRYVYEITLFIDLENSP